MYFTHLVLSLVYQIEIAMISNLVNLFNTEIQDKEKFLEFISSEFCLAKESIRTNWYSRGNIPERKQERLHTLTIDFIKHESGASTN